MDSISILLTAIGLAMDASAVSICNGMQIDHLRLRHMLRFGTFFGFFQGLMTLLGFLIGSSFRRYIQAFDHWLAFGLLVLIGGKMIADFARGDACPADEKKNGLNSYKTMFVLALATSIDALAVGISFSVIRVNLWLAVGIIAGVSFVCSFVSVWLGKRLGAVLGKWAELVGGIILTGIGIKILVEHLILKI